jgi:c(7)-type cytochrome triheme protein
MRFTTSISLGLLAGLGVVAAAGSLPGLPEPLRYESNADSPGPVTFDHENHLGGDRPDCTACHPRLFPILRDANRGRGVITHEAMDAGKLCGACHDGEHATELDECSHCHTE